MRCMWSPDRGGDLPLRLQIKIAFLRRSNRLLLQDEGFTFIVSLDELHRDQHSPHPEKANTHPDVDRLAVGVREYPLDNTDLLPHRIVDRVTSTVVGCRRSCPAHVGWRVYCCFGHFVLLSRRPGGGTSGSAEAGGKPRPLRWLPTTSWSTPCAAGSLRRPVSSPGVWRARR